MGEIGRPQRVIEAEPRRRKPRPETTKATPPKKPARKQEPAKTR